MPFESPRVTSPLKCVTLSAVVHVISSTSFKRPSEAEQFAVALGLLLRNIITLPRVLIKMAAAAIAAAEVAAEAVAEAVAETAAGKNK